MLNPKHHSVSVALVLLMLALAATSTHATPLTATVVDRNGDRHEVRNLAYQQQPEFELYVGDIRQLVRFSQIERLSLGGNTGERQLPATVTMRDGQVFKARMYDAGAGGAAPHRSVVSGPTSHPGLTGSSDLGPFVLQLNGVRDILFHHTDEAQEAVRLGATVVDTQGRRFEVDNLRFRNRTTFHYEQGRNRRVKQMARIARIDFEESSQATESRNVSVTFVSGKVARGTIEAGTVRVPGETDRLHQQRVFEAMTGTIAGAPFALGLHQVRLIRFRHADGDPVTQDETSAPTPAPPGN